MNPILLTLILLLTGVAGGLISSTAGMASLVTYPVLLALGVPPVSANVTNTAAMIFTGVGSGLASTQELSAHRKMMWQVGVWAVIGGIVGALILAVAPASSFEKVVPFLIAIAGVLMLSSLRQKPAPEQVGHTVRGWRLVGRNFLIFLVGGVYRLLRGFGWRDDALHFGGDLTRQFCRQQRVEKLRNVADQYCLAGDLRLHHQSLLADGDSAGAGDVCWRPARASCRAACV